jgi:hypothetical protein
VTAAPAEREHDVVDREADVNDYRGGQAAGAVDQADGGGNEPPAGDDATAAPIDPEEDRP